MSEPVLKLPRKSWNFYRIGHMGHHYARIDGRWYGFHSMGARWEVKEPPAEIYDPAKYRRVRA